MLHSLHSLPHKEQPTPAGVMEFMMSLSRFFSTLAAPRAIALGVAFAALATLSGCGTSDPTDGLDPSVFDGLHGKQVSNYALVPMTKKLSDKPDAATVYTGEFKAVIKTNEIINSEALNAKGETGTMTCSTFMIVPMELTEKGNLAATYRSGWGRCSTSSLVVIRPANNTMAFPDISGARGCGGKDETLSIRSTYSLCKFTAKPAP